MLRYHRGAHPNWLTPHHARKRGLVYLGTTDRLRMAMHKLQQGGRAKVTVRGMRSCRSLSVGTGADAYAGAGAVRALPAPGIRLR